MHESIRQQVGFIVSITVIKNAVKDQAVPKQQHITILFRTSHMLRQFFPQNFGDSNKMENKGL